MALVSPCPLLVSEVFYGATGNHVRMMQQSLKNNGCYGGSIDGVYGPMTRDGLLAFKSYHGLGSSTTADKETLHYLIYFGQYG